MYGRTRRRFRFPTRIGCRCNPSFGFAFLSFFIFSLNNEFHMYEYVTAFAFDLLFEEVFPLQSQHPANTVRQR